ncbi:MAG: hypothetical protein A4S09_16165 [Proteobacteria bacterium SG_bin7]|nr:MAG: hypothetical protein A4S09_16165 [Proteobacteria bacterium SG_bin7]
MKAIFSALIILIAFRANAVTVEDMVLVPDERHPFYINIFEVSDLMFYKVSKIRRYKEQVDNWPTKVVSPEEAEAYCKGLGLRVPTLDEWMTAATNLGQNKNYSVIGDHYQDAAGKKTFNWDGGDSVPVDDVRAGIDSIGTVGMSGNRSEWVIDSRGNYLQCGGDYKIRHPKTYHFNTICGGSNTVIFSSTHRATVRCVIDYSPDIQVTYSARVKGQIKENLDRLSQNTNPILENGEGQQRIPDGNQNSQKPSDPKANKKDDDRFD